VAKVGGTKMKRQIVIQNMKPLSRAKMQSLTTNNIANLMMTIMKSHVGRDEAISREDLFQTIFKRPEKQTLEDWVRWEFVKKAMHLCRQRTRCFIASEQTDRNWYYFVVKDANDADKYTKVLEKNITRMRAMQERAYKAAEEEWHKENWVLPGRKVKEIEDQTGDEDDES
jgi:hypothetical protein